MKWILLTAALLSMCIVSRENTVLACSGPEPTVWSLNYMLNWSDYFVKAKITDLDDAGQNAILEVDYSLKGIAPANLLLYNTNPILPQMHITHGYDTMCDYSGRFFGRVGEIGFFPLKRQSDGTYQTIYPSAGFPDFSSESTIYLSPDIQNIKEDGYAWDNDQLKSVNVRTEAEFIALAQTYGAGAIQQPDKERDIMAFAPIRVRTDKGEDYIVPIDGSISESQLAPRTPDVQFNRIKDLAPWITNYCQKDSCLTLSPDGSLVIVKKDTNTLIFGYPYWNNNTAEIPGQLARFSPSNDVLLVWDTDHFAIYQIKVVGMSDYLRPVPVLLHIFKPILQYPVTNDLRASIVRWSQNGNFLTYGDYKGIWAFDLYFSNQPELVAKSDGKNPAQALEISDDGRFVAYSLEGSRQTWTLLDRITDRSYQNLLITPNRRHAIGFELHDYTGLTNQLPFLNSVRNYGLDSDERWSIHWISGDGYLIKMCSTTRLGCRINICDFGNFDYVDAENIPCGDSKFFLKDFTGDADFAPNLGIVVGTDHYLDFYSGTRHYDRRNLALNGKIISVEWLPSLYYFRSQQ